VKQKGYLTPLSFSFSFPRWTETISAIYLAVAAAGPRGDSHDFFSSSLFLFLSRSAFLLLSRFCILLARYQPASRNRAYEHADYRPDVTYRCGYARKSGSVCTFREQ
jgi:hypothetical protein